MPNIRTVTELFEQSVRLYPDNIAVSDGIGSITYKEMASQVTLLANGLSRFGIRKGDRVVICLPNWHEMAIIYFALAKIGAMLVPCNVKYREEEISRIVQNSGAKAVFIMEEHHHLDIMNKIGRQRIQHIFSVRFIGDDVTSLEELMEIGQEAEPPSDVIQSEDVFTIIYTSGSTGQPKGAELTHRNVLHVAISTASNLGATCRDVFYVPVPATHVFGLVAGMLTAISVGAKILFLPKYHPIKALELIEKEKVTIHLGVPTTFKLELNSLSDHHFDLSSLRTGIIAGAPCPAEIVRRVRTEMNCNVAISYGTTETSAGISFTRFEDSEILRTETVGKAVDGADIKVVNDEGIEVGRGEIGEVVCRGAGVMKGYYNSPSITKECLDQDGWFHTGDLGTMDNEGYIRIVGRKKEVINCGGFKIYPPEIENLFYKHPAVLEVAVFGMPDQVLGEVPCAAISLKEEYAKDEEIMKDFIKEKIAKYKVPKRIVFMDDFPKTESGKIKKRELIQILADREEATRV
ncbi:class I adenylate-forming enzyme family protein [Brevibacillus ginsengisoli]|uniref:class I adenylate-forming enzyme family protein n=1 Tax=Brevibacillus ginsengisoli TaxID=363854 RepID=UPI003CF35D99